MRIVFHHQSHNLGMVIGSLHSLSPDQFFPHTIDTLLYKVYIFPDCLKKVDFQGLFIQLEGHAKISL